MTTVAPPSTERDPAEWARRNLFSTWYNSALTVLFVLLFAWLLLAVVRGLFGADYTILRTNLTLFMVGPYPRDEIWRVAFALIGLGLAGGIAFGVQSATARRRAELAGRSFEGIAPLGVLRRVWPVALVALVGLLLAQTVMPWLVVAGAVAAVAAGFAIGRFLPVGWGFWRWGLLALVALISYIYLAAVPWDEWGGFLTNLFVALAGIVIAFPFGLLLALGRRSTFPAFRTLSVTYIEFIRGVPLITLLLMGIFVLGFFLPEGLRPGNLTRVLVAIVLFEAAYVAEVVRGGLQSVPKGQTEGGQSLGLSAWGVTRRIVLPQALRNTIPAMVGQFISLFKDTSLLVVVGIPEILGVSSLANNQPDFLGQGLFTVTLPFVGLFFWAFSYMMSRESRRLERRLGVGER